MILYKYLSPTAALATLRNCTLRYTSPLSFNDPYDVQRYCCADKSPQLMLEDFLLEIESLATTNCSIDDLTPEWNQNIETLRTLARTHGYRRESLNSGFRGVLAEKENQFIYSMAVMQKWLDVNLPRLRVLCLSSSYDSILMWSHYAENHRGLVLELSNIDPAEHIFGPAPVEYAEIPFAFVKARDVIDRTLRGVNSEPKYADVIARKASYWSYENEWRAAKEVEPEHDDSVLDVSLRADQLTSILFGSRAHSDFVNECVRLAQLINPMVNLYQTNELRTHYDLSVRHLLST